MFASQLLRVLQTLPNDIKQKSCVYDPSEQDMIMKENQKGTLHNDGSLWMEVDPLPPVSNDVPLLVDQTIPETFPPCLEFKSGDESWNPFLEGFSMDIGHGTEDSPITEDRNGYIHKQNNLETDEHPSFSGENVEQKVQISLQNGTRDYVGTEDHDGVSRTPNSMEKDRDSSSAGTNEELMFHSSSEKVKRVEECTDFDENESNEPSKLNLDASDLFRTEINMFTDKKVEECEPPESIGSREVTVKDICVDEGVYPTENVLHGILENDQSIISIPKPVIDHSHHTSNVINASDKDSFIGRTLPIQEYGTRSFLRSFISSLDSDQNEAAQYPSQVSTGKSVPDVASEQDAQGSSQHCSNMVDGGSSSSYFSASSDANVEGSKNASDVSVDNQSCNKKEENSGDLSPDAELHVIDDCDQSAALHTPKQKNENYNHEILSNEKYDAGETSFSKDSFITYSGPIPYSGSISMRSDGSATSSRSFAFPILQSEWNSSPVRMAKADRRNFRKHKGWRSGLLCCRF